MRLELYSKENELFLLCNAHRVLGISSDGHIISFYTSTGYRLARVYMQILLKTSVNTHVCSNQFVDEIIIQLFASLVLF